MFPLGFRMRGNFFEGDLIGQRLQSVMSPCGRRLWVNLIGQWLQTVSNIKHIIRWGADGAITSGRLGNQHPYSYAYKTTRTEAQSLAGMARK